VRLLLDTHIAIWAVMDDPRLGSDTRAAISAAQNTVGVSLASLWEIAIKNNLGRVAREPFGMSMPQALGEFRAADFEILPIDDAAIERVEKMPRLHGDPFDRLLIATASVGSWQFMTHDRALTAYGPHILAV
jgi:PIN domain nuclease of toxin-antitoxin system